MVLLRGLALAAFLHAGASADEPFRLVEPFGPEDASFPWSAAGSPDGAFLVTVEGRGDIVVRKARTGKALQRIAHYPGYPMGVAFSPDGRHLLAGGRRRETGERGAATLLWARRD